jgi:hypothetical protein
LFLLLKPRFVSKNTKQACSSVFSYGKNRFRRNPDPKKSKKYRSKFHQEGIFRKNTFLTAARQLFFGKISSWSSSGQDKTDKWVPGEKRSPVFSCNVNLVAKRA